MNAAPWFLVPKPHSRWRPILGLDKPSLSETIRTSLQQGEWVTSVDFKEAYFHIPIQEQSRKYLRFHIQRQAYQFKALPFGLPTAPMEFTVIPKEVKLMAIHKGLRIHQYLDWLVRARSHQACLQHTQELVKNVSAVGLADELREIRAGAQTRLRFCRLPVRPQVWSGPTDSGPVAEPSRENTETAILPACPVREFMPLIGLLTATEKFI